VGDIHGQLPDLIHILQDSGFPSVTNKYIFNGDFVDRGPKGIYVYKCILMEMLLIEGLKVGIFMCLYKYIYVCVYICIFVYVYIYTYACIFIYIQW
jgi:hypothetical protein